MALVAAEATVVYWLPAEPDLSDVTYNVYGEVDGVLVLIENTRATAAVVLERYDRFAVSTVSGDDESDPKYSIGGVCVKPQDAPWVVHQNCSTAGVHG